MQLLQSTKLTTRLIGIDL